MSTLECDPATALAEIDVGSQPVRKVKDVLDMEKWRRSETYVNILSFINCVSSEIQGKKLSDLVYVSPFMVKLLGILDFLNSLIDQTPKDSEHHKMSHKSYRSWYRKMINETAYLLHQAIPQEKCAIVTELSFYLNESFGNTVRVDYGTGHELSFIFFILALYKAEMLSHEDNQAVALRLFNKYIELCRRLQTVFSMKPAGSQGVWSLDDYQFIPYLWGAAQLCYKTPFEPLFFLEDHIIKEYKDDYMLIACVAYKQRTKSGHFAEHSCQLWAITSAPSWPKLYEGLQHMFIKEVLLKYPIIQNCLFGNLIMFELVSPGTTITPPYLGHSPNEVMQKQAAANLKPTYFSSVESEVEEESKPSTVPTSTSSSSWSTSSVITEDTY